MSDTDATTEDSAIKHSAKVPQLRTHSLLDRERWIAEAAYYRAEKRGFAPGFAWEDWVVAEGLIDYEISQGLLMHLDRGKPQVD